VDAKTGIESKPITLTLKGITEVLKQVFWPDYVRVSSAVLAKVRGKRRPRGSNSTALNPESSLQLSAQEKQQRKSFKQRIREGLALGTRVHHELHVYSSIMNFSVHGISKNKNARYNAVLDALSVNGKQTGIHPCTHAIIQALETELKWNLLAAEWCVGDVSSTFQHATQIDLIACRADQPHTLILIEVKTGYNNGAFYQASGVMKTMPASSPSAPVISNAPVNQAKMQLVFGAAMFCATYNIKWKNVELYVVHCPSQAPFTVRVLPVAPKERSMFLNQIHANKLM
jgi:hypothetical protein